MFATFQRYTDLLIRYLRIARAKVALLSILVLANLGLQLVNPLLLRRFLDSAMAAEPLGALTGLASLFIAVAVGSRLIQLIEEYVAEDVAWTTTNRLREDLARHALSLDMAFHTVHPPSELIQRLDFDIGTLSNFFSRFLLRIVTGGLLLAGALVMLTLLDWRVGAAFTLYVLLALAILYRISQRYTRYAIADLATMGSLFGYIQERLAGTEDIRARGAIPYALSGLYHYLRERLNARRKAGTMFVLMFGAMALFATGGTALAFALGAYLYRSGQITVGTVFAMTYYLTLIAAPLGGLMAQTQDMQRAAAGIRRVWELRDTVSAVQDGPGAPLPSGPLQVEVKDVCFAYSKAQPVLQDITFSLQPGAILGLLGRTGSGKTSLVRLLLRLYDPSAGAILIGGSDLRTLRQSDLRERIGLVTQEVELLHASVRDNLTLFDRTLADERLLEALRLLDIWDWYASLPAGLDTQLAGGDAGLSAGEAQLLALVRIFLRDPGLVILDEPSSRLDPATERRLERAVDTLLHNRTGIIVAHRLATVRRADAILVLEQGRIVEYGERVRLAADPASQYARLLRTGLEPTG
jgi:ATP-binding cassette subfamily B protein